MEAGGDGDIWPNGLGALDLWLLGLDEGFNFCTITHTTIAESVGFGVDDARAAMGLAWLISRDFNRHANSGFDGHAHLQGCGGDEEKAAAGNIGGLGEVVGTISGQANRAKTQRNPHAKALKLSAFGRGHESLHWQRGGLADPHIDRYG